MSANELFKELGYKEEFPDDYDEITYSKDILDKKTFGYIDSEMITFGEHRIWFTNKIDFNLDELQAINKQVEELWGGNNDR